MRVPVDVAATISIDSNGFSIEQNIMFRDEDRAKGLKAPSLSNRLAQ